MKLNYFVIGNQIKKCRMRKHLTQMELAEVVDISTSYLSCLENGYRGISLEKAVALANALEVQKEWCGGVVWYEERYPNILFAKDGEIYTIEGVRHLVIGGAYSVDKVMRLTAGYKWWEDEQPSEATKRRVELQAEEKEIDIILSHTCPARYKPTEAFLPMIDQDTVDDSTEQWLDTLVDKISHKKWLCGHWHIDKHIDKMIFMFKDYLSLDEVLRERSNNE